MLLDYIHYYFCFALHVLVLPCFCLLLWLCLTFHSRVCCVFILLTLFFYSLVLLIGHTSIVRKFSRRLRILITFWDASFDMWLSRWNSITGGKKLEEISLQYKGLSKEWWKWTQIIFWEEGRTQRTKEDMAKSPEPRKWFKIQMLVVAQLLSYKYNITFKKTGP